MTANIAIDFLSRQCRYKAHDHCNGLWNGLGFEAVCKCRCHKKKEKASVEEWEPDTNASNITKSPLSLEVSKEDG
jgi:hypothetical protein